MAKIPVSRLWSPLDGVEGAASEVHDPSSGSGDQPHGAAAEPFEKPSHALFASALHGFGEHARHAVYDSL